VDGRWLPWELGWLIVMFIDYKGLTTIPYLLTSTLLSLPSPPAPVSAPNPLPRSIILYFNDVYYLCVCVLCDMICLLTVSLFIL